MLLGVMKGKAIVIFTCFCLHVFIVYDWVAATPGDAKEAVFSTWEGFEVDKCASIWLIQRFISKGAKIKLFPKGQPIEEGIPFDVPDAGFRRYHNMSTFESLLRHYRINDPKLIRLGKIIHDIEVNLWERKVLEETLTVQEEVNNIILNSRDSLEVIEKSMKYFDQLYGNLATKVQ